MIIIKLEKNFGKITIILRMIIYGTIKVYAKILKNILRTIKV